MIYWFMLIHKPSSLGSKVEVGLIFMQHLPKTWTISEKAGTIIHHEQSVKCPSWALEQVDESKPLREAVSF